MSILIASIGFLPAIKLKHSQTVQFGTDVLCDSFPKMNC